MLNNTSTLTTAVLLAAYGGVASANSYQFDITGNIEHYHYDEADGEADEHIYHVTGTYYFTPVNTKGHPLAQAAFMERASNISIDYQYWPSDYKYSEGGLNYKTDEKYQSLGVMARMYWLDKWLYTSIGILESESKVTERAFDRDGNFVGTDKYESHTHGRVQGTVGISPFAGLLVYTGLYEGESWTDAKNINVQYLHNLGATNAIATTMRYSEFDDNRNVTIEADYYFTPRLSLGVGYVDYEDYSLDYDWMTRARYFFLTNASVDVFVKDYEGTKSYAVGGTFRF